MRKEILTINEIETSIEASGNQISSIRNKNITKSGARYFTDNKIFSTSYVGQIGDEDLLSAAISNTDSAIAFEYDLAPIQPTSKHLLLKTQSTEDLLPEYQKALGLLVNKFPDFIFSGKANLKRISKSLRLKDEGLLEEVYESCEWYFLYKHKNSPGFIDGFLGSEDIGSFDIAGEVQKYFPMLESFTNETKLEAGIYPVVFVDSSQLFSKILESARADYYKKDIGLYKGKLGKKILNNAFTLYDVSFDPEINALNLFDADGFQRSSPYLPIVSDGVFTSLVTDSRNAHKYSLPLTGNTKRAFDSSSTLGFNTISVKPGSKSTEEILSSLPKCIVVEMAAGGDFTDLGDYSTPVQNGFLLEKGKLVGKIPQATLTSSVQKMFGDDLIDIASGPFSGLSKCPAIFSNMNLILN